MLPNTLVMWKEPSSIILAKAKILVWDLSKKLNMNLVSWHCGINPSYLGRRSRIGIAFSTSYKKSHFQAHRWVAHCQEQGVKRQTKHLMAVTNSESFESRMGLWSRIQGTCWPSPSSVSPPNIPSSVKRDRVGLCNISSSYTELQKESAILIFYREP